MAKGQGVNLVYIVLKCADV